MELISREELKSKLDRGDDFKLFMVLGEWAFRLKHIPGSLNVSSPEQAEGVLFPEDEIVIYCSGPECIASIAAFGLMEQGGFGKVRRYAGGLRDWEDAGLPLEGEAID